MVGKDKGSNPDFIKCFYITYIKVPMWIFMLLHLTDFSNFCWKRTSVDQIL